MAVWSEIFIKDIEQHRVDAEYYQPKYLFASKLVGNKKLKKYGVMVQHPAETRRIYADSGIQIVLAQNNRNNFYDWSEKRYMPNHMKVTLVRNHLEYGDVTVTRSGANYGQTSVITIEEKNNLYACADLLIIKTSEIAGPLLSTYFNTKIGKDLMERGVYGAGQPHVAPAYIKEIAFPQQLLSINEEIERIIVNARNYSERAQSLHTQSQELLERELGLDKLVFDKPLSYEAKVSDVVGKLRGDAEFHNPMLKAYYRHLSKKHKLGKITEYLKVLKFGNPIYSRKGIPIITQKHLQDITPASYGADLLADKSWVQKYPLAILKKNDLLFYSVGAYLGKTNIWLNEDKAVHASFITMLRCQEEIDSGYLMALLNSKYGLLQSKVFQSGTSQQYIYPKDIRQFLVPKIAYSLKVKLYDLIINSQKAKVKSQQLLEQAKRQVEDLIEKAVEK